MRIWSVPDCRQPAASGEQRCELHLQRKAVTLARLWPGTPTAAGWQLIVPKQSAITTP
jgi:hypothetical protein